MPFNPITHADGTQYDVMIPDEVEVKTGPMIDISFTSDDGDEYMVSLFTRHAVALVSDLVEALAVQKPRYKTQPIR